DLSQGGAAPDGRASRPRRRCRGARPGAAPALARNVRGAARPGARGALERGRGVLSGIALMALAVCATPIGNLDDVTLRVLAELRDADLVLCEDTRHTRTLLVRHGIDAHVLSYHEHNEAARTAELLPRLEAGERIALVPAPGPPGV